MYKTSSISVLLYLPDFVILKIGRTINNNTLHSIQSIADRKLCCLPGIPALFRLCSISNLGMLFLSFCPKLHSIQSVAKIWNLLQVISPTYCLSLCKKESQTKISILQINFFTNVQKNKLRILNNYHLSKIVYSLKTKS